MSKHGHVRMNVKDLPDVACNADELSEDKARGIQVFRAIEMRQGLGVRCLRCQRGARKRGQQGDLDAGSNVRRMRIGLSLSALPECGCSEALKSTVGHLQDRGPIQVLCRTLLALFRESARLSMSFPCRYLCDTIVAVLALGELSQGLHQRQSVQLESCKATCCRLCPGNAAGLHPFKYIL